MSGPEHNADEEGSPAGISASADFSYELATRTLLARLANRSPPAPIPAPAPEPKERYWPARCAARPLPLVNISLRHPACDFAFQDLDVRQIGRSPRSSTHGRQSRFPSMKMGRQMRANSDLEFDGLRDCELDPNVLKFVEQPAWLTYSLAGRETRHKGDILILRCEGLEWCEIKYESEACRVENETRWDAIGPALNSLGISFRVVTERHIRQGVRWENVKAIWENRLSAIPAEAERIAILNEIDAVSTITLLQLRNMHSLELSSVLALVRRGFLALDLAKPICDASVVRRGSGLKFSVGSRIYGQ